MILHELEDKYDIPDWLWDIVFDSIWAEMKLVQVPYKRARRLRNFRRSHLFKSKI